MRLGTDTGSLVSHVLTTSAQPVPEAGMPATFCGWTDRHPATVIEVQTGKATIVVVQEDSFTKPEGVCNAFTEAQTWNYSRNPEGRTIAFRLTPAGRWEEVRKGPTGRWNKAGSGGYGLILGRREKYYDPSF